MISPETRSYQLIEEEAEFNASETGKLAKYLFRRYKRLIDEKFPLVQTTAMNQTVFVNEALAEGDVINFLYLPEDKSRSDPEKQIKVSSSRDNMTVIIKDDKDNPEISFQVFDTTDEIPRMVSYKKNSPDACAKISKMLSKLRGLRDFGLVYPPTPLT